MSGPSAAPGTIKINSVTGRAYVVDDHKGGGTSSLRLLETYWGRLVDIYDYDSQTGSTSRVFRDFVISDAIMSDGVDFRLERDALTEQDRLTVLHKRDSAEFLSAMATVEQTLQVMLRKSLDPSELPPFTAVPRNAALLLCFNDLLDDGGNPDSPEYPGTVDASTVALLTGYAPTAPYETRIFPDANHGDELAGQFHSTRVIIDLTVSESDARSYNLPVNAIGLPDAVNASQPNGVIRIATRTSAGSQQLQVLHSLGGRTLDFNGNGPTDPAATTFDVIRAFRSGGKTTQTGDLYNGFLVDIDPPRVVGTQIVTVVQTGPLGGPEGNEFDLTVDFQTDTCAVAPTIGDVLEFPNHRLQVLQDFAGSVGTGMVGPFRVGLLCENCVPSTPPVQTAGQYITTFRTGLSSDPAFPACFVRFSPAPATLPNIGVPTGATMTITFTEPIDPASVTAFDTFTVEYGNNLPAGIPAAPNTPPMYKNVVGGVVPSQDLRRYTFQPKLPLRLQALAGGVANAYTFNALGGVGGITDLAGNNLFPGLSAVPFKLPTNGTPVDSFGVCLRFNSTDENNDGNPDIRGQFLYDLQRKLIQPRPVSRFSATVDPTQAIVGAMVRYPQPLQTPLSNWGSRLMAVWRYHDLGLPLRSDNGHNLDVEGMWWEPFSGVIQIDHFAQFQMGFAHCKFLPDEAISSGLLPMYTGSGLVAKFEDNLLDKTSDPLTIVHPKAKGYTLQTSDIAQSATGYPLAPWPLNRGVPADQFVYWTWRDTSKLMFAGPSGAGADTKRYAGLVGAANSEQGFYASTKVPTIGLPLLIDFRAYEDAQAIGQNGFRIALAINSSARPFFRVFSTGGVNPSNPQDIKHVNPDTEVTATGGKSQNGQPSPGFDNVVYMGQADFLVRISRVHTIWFDTSAAATLYGDPVVEPGVEALPAGTQLVLGYRGASAFTPASTSWTPPGYLAYQDAFLMDPYGDNFTTTTQLTFANQPTQNVCTPTFYPTSTDKSWKNSIASINGARYFQVRATFFCNPISGMTPELSALGFAFRR